MPRRPFGGGRPQRLDRRRGRVPRVHRVDRVYDGGQLVAAHVRLALATHATDDEGQRHGQRHGLAELLGGAEVGLMVGRGRGIDLLEARALVRAEPPHALAVVRRRMLHLGDEHGPRVGQAPDRPRAAPRGLERQRAQPGREPGATVRGRHEDVREMHDRRARTWAAATVEPDDGGVIAHGDELGATPDGEHLVEKRRLALRTRRAPAEPLLDHTPPLHLAARPELPPQAVVGRMELRIGGSGHAVQRQLRPVEVGGCDVSRREIGRPWERSHAVHAPLASTSPPRVATAPPACFRCRMGTFDLAELRRLDQATHLHPFTDHRAMHRDGTHVVRSGHGCLVVDETGRELLDGLAGLWCVNVGYGREEIVEAVRAQMRTLAFYPSFFNSTTEPTIRLAARLAELAPPLLGHTIFSSSGSEANETALKLVRAYWKLRGERARRTVLSRTFAYHGVGLATASLTALASCTDPFDLPLPGFVRVPGPYAYAAGTTTDRKSVV